VPVLAVAAAIFRFKVRSAFRDVRVRIARINAHIQETVTGMKVVQLFAREDRNMRDFDAMNAGHRDAWQRSIHYDALLFATVFVPPMKYLLAVPALAVTLALAIAATGGWRKCRLRSEPSDQRS